MTMSVTPDAISQMIANKRSDSSDLVIQVLDLKTIAGRFRFTAKDGKMKIGAIVRSEWVRNPEEMRNSCLIRVCKYSVREIRSWNEKFVIILECHVVSKIGVKPKQESRNEKVVCTLPLADKRFNTVQNDHEITLYEYSQVEECSNEETSIADESEVKKKVLVRNEDATAVGETLPDMVDKSPRNEDAPAVGETSLDIVDKSPIVAITPCNDSASKASSKSIVLVNPDIRESKRLRSCDMSMQPSLRPRIGRGLSPNISKIMC